MVSGPGDSPALLSHSTVALALASSISDRRALRSALCHSQSTIRPCSTLLSCPPPPPPPLLLVPSESSYVARFFLGEWEGVRGMVWEAVRTMG